MGPLLATLTQPLEATPTPIGHVDVAWSALAPILFLVARPCSCWSSTP